MKSILLKEKFNVDERSLHSEASEMFLLKSQWKSVDLANISSRRGKLKLQECQPGNLTAERFKSLNLMRSTHVQDQFQYLSNNAADLWIN